MKDFALLLMFVAASISAGPQTGSKPAFEVASIKKNTVGRSPSTRPVNIAGDRFTTIDASVMWLLQFAFRADTRQLRYVDVIGLPAWGTEDGFDIQAKAESGGGPVSQEQMQLMVQSLLKDRFQLKAHFETREMPVYDLLLLKEGKLKPGSGPGEPRLMAMPSASGELTLKMINPNMSLLDFTNFLQDYVGRPVIDKTRLSGQFDVNLQFSEPRRALATETTGPSVSTALREQLGLRLESATGPVKVLVIDSVQKPSEN